MRISLFILALFFSSCSSVSTQEGVVNSIINQHGREQEKENNLKLVGAGSSIPDNVHGFILHYNAPKKITIDEARRDYVQGVEKLLVMINSNDELKPYMYEYPFTDQNIDYRLSFIDQNSDYPEYPYVALVSSYKGKIFYSFYDNKQQSFIDDKRVSEPYAEAARIVQEEQGK